MSNTDYVGVGDVEDPLRLLIWAAANALARTAADFRREVKRNPGYRHRLSKLQPGEPISEQDQVYWSDLLRGRHSRARGRLAGDHAGTSTVAVSGSLLRRAAVTPEVRQLIARIEQPHEPLPMHARELLAELFAGKLVRSAGQPARTVDELRTIGEAYDALRPKVDTAEEAYDLLGKRFKIHPRVVEEHLHQWRSISPCVGPRLRS